MALFSQRKDFKPIRKTVQLEIMDESLKNAIWNCLHMLRYRSTTSASSKENDVRFLTWFQNY
jgi:hypothetical protein